jgi:putative ABC transport system permease protein
MIALWLHELFVGRAVSLARASLLHESKRFLPAVLAVAFAGLLILVQLGLLLGMFGTVSVVVDRTHADLWVGFPGTPSFDLGRSISDRLETRLRLHPEVAAVERMVIGYGDWRDARGKRASVMLIGLDHGPAGIGQPAGFGPELRAALREPDAVIVDAIDVEKLAAQPGGMVEINGKRARVSGVTSGYRNIGGAYVFTSLATARRMLGLEPERTSYLLVKLRDPARIDAVRHALQPDGRQPAYSVWTARELSRRSQLYWLLESGAGASFGFSSVLALIVGVVITSQTLAGAILASLREYATLRALGVSARALSGIVMEQAFWVGAAGLVVAGVATLLANAIAAQLHIDILFPWWSVVATGITTWAAALGSGVWALHALFRLEPAELLR